MERALRSDAKIAIGAMARAAGGRGWDRTSDPYDVNVVLSR